MKTSKKGINLIKKYESFRNNPYLCPAGIPTIGWGSTYYEDGTKVTLEDGPITRDNANILLNNVIQRFEAGVSDLTTSKLTSNQFDALVSFAYNLGLNALKKSTLLKKVNKNPQDSTIKDEFKKWNKARVNGKLTVLNGLVKRRNEEAYLYFQV